MVTPTWARWGTADFIRKNDTRGISCICLRVPRSTDLVGDGLSKQRCSRRVRYSDVEIVAQGVGAGRQPQRHVISDEEFRKTVKKPKVWLFEPLTRVCASEGIRGPDVLCLQRQALRGLHDGVHYKILSSTRTPPEEHLSAVKTCGARARSRGP